MPSFGGKGVKFNAAEVINDPQLLTSLYMQIRPGRYVLKLGLKAEKIKKKRVQRQFENSFKYM